jgi:hypothetical protein
MMEIRSAVSQAYGGLFIIRLLANDQNSESLN